jgi:Rod binding domain-containing protein
MISAPAMPLLTGSPITPPATPKDPAKLWQAARDFEAMALGELLRPMFETVDSKPGLFGGGEAEKMWKPMWVDEIARQVAATGVLGLAVPIHDAMLRMREGQQ